MIDPEKFRRITVRMPVELAEQATFWASRAPEGDKRGISLNDYVIEAIFEKISRESGAIPDIDNIVTMRLNQVIDNLAALTTEVSNSTSVMTNGFDSIIAMGRGTNYLADDETGELDER